MTEGEHVLLIKAWNVANNSGQTTLSFRVVASSHLALTHVLNYPNPFTTHTTFWFEHNRPGEDLSVLVQILTVSGKLVKSLRRTINTPGNRSSEIDWDGRDDYGAKIGKGVYIYRLRVRGQDGTTADVFEKLYIL
jgi:flagellar hook assembly protein FlgD